MIRHLNSESHDGSPQENYERYFVPVISAPLALDLVEAAALRSGEHVLDVACGTGVVARLAAERVGTSGTVAGLDLDPGMVATARSVTPDGLSIEWHEASADATRLPDEAFDVVFCQLGLQFVPDKSAALREMWRVLAPGGRVLLNVPGTAGAIFVIMDEVFERHIGPEAAGLVRAPFSLHDPGEIRPLIHGAGFRNVDVRSGKKALRLPPPRKFLWQYVHSTPLVELFADADDESRVALERDVVVQWEDFVENGALTYEQDVVVATARK